VEGDFAEGVGTAVASLSAGYRGDSCCGGHGDCFQTRNPGCTFHWCHYQYQPLCDGIAEVNTAMTEDAIAVVLAPAVQQPVAWNRSEFVQVETAWSLKIMIGLVPLALAPTKSSSQFTRLQQNPA
jgi:hypothetical protein